MNTLKQSSNLLPSQKSSADEPSKALAWIVIGSFALISVFGAFIGLGKILNYAVPAGSLLVSLFLYFRHPVLYVEFVWWVWFLAPLVRRLVDYRSGFIDPSPILLSPYLATLPTIITAFQRLPKLNREGGLPFILAMVGVAYGFLIGVINQPLQPVIISLLGWLSPLTFGCHLFTHWRDYPLYSKSLMRTFFWCVLLVGSYGIYQYIVAPEWDRFWLTQLIDQLNTVTFGIPEPQGIRVWGTMNGPLIFAASMSAGLLLLINKPEPLANIAIVVGFLSFLLSQVRTSWIGWLIGMAVLITSLKQHLQIRLIVIITFLAACIISLAMIEPFSEVISARTSTLTNVQEDTSAVERSQTYDRVLRSSLTNVFGDGISTADGADSGILEILIKLGWLGGIFYVSGIILLLGKPLKGGHLGKDVFAKTSHAIALSLFAQLPLGAVMLDLPGVILWVFLGMKLAAWKYHSYGKTASPEVA